MGATNADVILTDADGDNIVIDSFVTGDDNTILFVEMQQEDGETASGTVAADATDEAGHVGILKDDNTAGFQKATGTGVVSLSDTAAFTVVGGDAGVAAGDATNSHFQGASKTSTLVTVGATDLTTQAGAKSAISAIDGALNQVASRRASLGAISNRIDNTIANLTNINQNVQASRSSILDTDFSVETSQLTKSQILQQAATSMLAQANASKQSVLSLLQG
jgi:flagellin